MIDQLPGDPNLPPGCSNRDIDRRFGFPECQCCGTELEFMGVEDFYCPKCEPRCPDCGEEVAAIGKCCQCAIEEERDREEARSFYKLRIRRERGE